MVEKKNGLGDDDKDLLARMIRANVDKENKILSDMELRVRFSQ